MTRGSSIAGLIPAHAGKTRRSDRVASKGGAHPRSRGENASLRDVLLPENGSSPLTRGKLGSVCALDALTGLIPAHAGKTEVGGDSDQVVRAHPRSRGENVFAAPMIVLIWGSSPLTRGKLDRFSAVVVSFGLIPAHAGKTLANSDAPVIERAHPRSRGENSLS